MDSVVRDHLLSNMVPAVKDCKFCDCTTQVCTCGEEIKGFEWVWDGSSANPDTVVLSCQNRETLFHPRVSSGTTAIRGTIPFKKGNIYYWEIKMLSLIYGTNVIVGVGTKDAALNTDHYCSLIGQDKESWGYSYKGELIHNGQNWTYGDKFDQGSIIGVKLDLWNGQLEFYLNRKPLGVAFKNMDKYDQLYPIISSTAANSAMRMINSSSRPASLMHHCVLSLQDHFDSTQCLHSIPSIKDYLKKSWWSFSHDNVLYENNIRKKDYHWFLDDKSDVSVKQLLRWNMRR